MTEVWLEAAEKTCGKTKGPVRHKETWWWNNDTEVAVTKKRHFYRAWKQSRTPEDREAYLLAKREAKAVIWRSQEAMRKEFAARLVAGNEKGRQDFFRVAKQMSKEQQDVTGVSCIKNESGSIALSGDDVRARWAEYTEALLKEESSWTRVAAECCDPVEGPSRNVQAGEIVGALKKMAPHKGSGPSGIVSELMKASNSSTVAWMTDICNSIALSEGMPKAWSLSTTVPLYKGKGDPLECGSYRTIKLLEHGMKLAERVFESRLRTEVDVDEMQFGFMPGKSTTDAIFIVRQLQEKHLAKGRDLFFAFIDLEKAFDRVPRSVVRWALRRAGVLERTVDAVMSFYEDSRTIVRTRMGDSREVPVQTGVHQGSVLSPFLFTIVMDQVSRDARSGLPWEILYADDLVLMATTREELTSKVEKWSECLSRKGLKVNTNKSKVMISNKDKATVEHKEGRWPCGVCGRGVGVNSILCTTCNRWVHKRCSGISGSLDAATSTFKCRKCSNSQHPQAQDMEDITISGATFGAVKTFCYLGDVLSAAGGVDQAVTSRVRSGWKRFHELAAFLTSRAPLKIKGKVYVACIRSSMTYGCETWPLKSDQVTKLIRTENAMIRRLCGVRTNKKSSEELRQMLQIENVADFLRRSRLRWFGHVQRKENSDWVKKVTLLDVDGRRGIGRPRKTWTQAVAEDLRALNLKADQVYDRHAWRRAIWKNPSNPVRRAQRT